MNVREVIEPVEAPAVAPAFDVRLPEVLTSPFVFASPHSGRLYPDDMMAAAALDAEAIRRSEDAFVDVLAGTAPAHGIPLISVRYARAYIDVNREPYELDPAMFEDALPSFARSRTARVAAGLGSIARVVGEGQEIYARKLLFSDAHNRIEAVHKPYHQALTDLLAQARARFGMSVLVDWHSMPSAAAGGDAAHGRKAPDFVLGDRFGAACSPAVTALVERELEAMGYAVARNAPYAGGYTTEFYGRPAAGAHALQIEMNRALYLNEQTLERRPGFAKLGRDLERLYVALSTCNWRKFR